LRKAEAEELRAQAQLLKKSQEVAAAAQRLKEIQEAEAAAREVQERKGEAAETQRLKQNAKPIPLSKLSEFLPAESTWGERWQDEPMDTFKERIAKHRGEWISWFAATMKRGNTTQKKPLQFYQDLIKSEVPPVMHRDPLPKETAKALDMRALLRFPGDDHWGWQWEAESEEQWQDRQNRGYLDWYRYIDSVKDTRNGVIKARVNLYVELVREGRHPVPMEDWRKLERKADKLVSRKAQDDWME
jgi:hypothetical protein